MVGQLPCKSISFKFQFGDQIITKEALNKFKIHINPKPVIGVVPVYVLPLGAAAAEEYGVAELKTIADFLRDLVTAMNLAKGSGKDRSTDIPSWAKANKPKEGEAGKDFAKRLLDDQYGEGNWSGTGGGSEFSKLKKYGDRFDK
ncbi:hypothetical protein EPL05_19095 [Mucilaginibacter gilvus]|uniref:Uncharacterized protein n=1 Tax=Mucilaginibacter gilvus TaxID=2305909 RepID=A0A444MJJ0_9SPHI|nr:hypothetical protein EPL05_19095 [Mucilaginibacter gilvus]